MVSIVSERGTLLPNGHRVVYPLSDLASHSCSPNVVAEVLTEDGLREMRVIGFNGIAENEEVTVSWLHFLRVFIELCSLWVFNFKL